MSCEKGVAALSQAKSLMLVPKKIRVKIKNRFKARLAVTNIDSNAKKKKPERAR